MTNLSARCPDHGVALSACGCDPADLEVEGDAALEAFLFTVLESAQNVATDLVDDAPAVTRVATFEGDGVLTTDRGLVVRLADGSEFQITIVQSRRARVES